MKYFLTIVTFVLGLRSFAQIIPPIVRQPTVDSLKRDTLKTSTSKATWSQLAAMNAGILANLNSVQSLAQATADTFAARTVKYDTLRQTVANILTKTATDSTTNKKYIDSLNGANATKITAAKVDTSNLHKQDSINSAANSALSLVLSLKLNKSDTSTLLSKSAATSTYQPLGNYATKTRVNNIVSRPLNTAFQITTTGDAIVNYGVQMQSLIALQTATVQLQICPTSTGTFVTIGQTALPSVSLLFTLQNQITGVVPSGYYCKIAVTGTATVTALTGQESY